MTLTQAQLDAWGASFKARFDNEEPYEPPPSDITSSRSCTPTGLLTPSREDHGTARPTRYEPAPPPRPPLRDLKAAREQRRQESAWARLILAHATPDFFPHLGVPESYLLAREYPGLDYDWQHRSIRSNGRRQPYLFALHEKVPEGIESRNAVIAFLGDDSTPPDTDDEENMLPRKKCQLPKSKPSGITKPKRGQQKVRGQKVRSFTMSTRRSGATRW